MLKETGQGVKGLARVCCSCYFGKRRYKEIDTQQNKLKIRGADIKS